MITQKLQDAINAQITREIWSSNLYLSMAFYLDKEGFGGFATWMKKQSQEELEHAYMMADYVIKRGWPLFLTGVISGPLNMLMVLPKT